MKYWDYYISLFSDNDNKIVIAIWALTIALITFFLNFIIKPIYKNIIGYFQKVKVELGISHQLIQSVMGSSVGTPLITIKITNNTNKTIYINNPTIKTSRKINNEDKFVVPKPAEMFPKKLEVGEQFGLDYDSNSMYNQILRNLKSNDNIKAIITTTSSKKYTSNSITQNRIIGHMQIPHEMNKR